MKHTKNGCDTNLDKIVWVAKNTDEAESIITLLDMHFVSSGAIVHKPTARGV